jgi:hypothetical protein
MAVRKTRTKKRVGRRTGKIVMLGLPNGRVYIAPLSALGRPVRNAKLNKTIAALNKKTDKYWYGCLFGGVFPASTFAANFGNGHLPPH